MNHAEIIKSILEITNPVISNELKEKNNFPKGFTFFHVLERAQCSLQSIYVLAEDDIVKNDHAIGLISRNLLSDFITTGYIVKLSDSEEDVYSKLYSLHYSDLEITERYAKMLKESGKLEELEYLKFNQKYLNDNDIHKVIRDYCKQNELKEFPSITKIIKKFYSTKIVDAWTVHIQKSYDIWTHLSKYEHLGWNSYQTTRKTDNQSVRERLNNVLFMSSILVSSCFEMLGEKRAQDEINKCMKIYWA